MITATYGRIEFARLGRILASKKPELANELISAYMPEPVCFENIKHDYNSFCKIKSHTDKLEMRRLFICAMLLNYTPTVFEWDINLKKSRGFVKQLSITLEMPVPYISKMINQVIIWKGIYPDFSNAVDEIATKLKTA